MASLNLLKRKTLRPSRRVGRGGKRGKTAGRGTKGQNSRAGRKKRPEMRDIIKKLPKRRGYGKNRGRTVNASRPDPIVLSLARLDTLFANGAEITRAVLIEKGAVGGRSDRPIKIVGGLSEGATFTKKFALKDIEISVPARAVIEKAGGTITVSVPASKKA